MLQFDRIEHSNPIQWYHCVEASKQSSALQRDDFVLFVMRECVYVCDRVLLRNFDVRTVRNYVFGYQFSKIIARILFIFIFYS
jgi:hypothetical protein